MEGGQGRLTGAGGPTIGVDVGSKAEIYSLLRCPEGGMAVLLISSDSGGREDLPRALVFNAEGRRRDPPSTTSPSPAARALATRAASDREDNGDDIVPRLV